MIVKNEERNLESCIQPMKSIVDEIVVVDTGSTDGTKEIAKELGARVFDFSWCDDFGAARNESLRHAGGDYILWLDADDRVDESEVEKIKRLKRRFPLRKNEAYYFIINSQSPIDGETLFYQIRIFPKVEGVKFEGKIHEQVVYNLQRLGLRLVNTDIRVRHSGYRDLTTIQEKSERNLRILQKELERDPENILLHFYTSRTLAGMGRQDEAVFHMRKITEDGRIRKNEKQFFMDASLLLGKYYVELKLYDEAISIFKNLATAYGEKGLVHFCLGESLFLVKDYRGAIEALQKSLLFPINVSLLPINPDQIRHSQYQTLAQCYLEMGEVEMAKEILTRFLDRYQGHHKSFEALGLLSLKERKYKEASEFYEKAIEEGGTSDQNYANLGLAYRKIGQWAEAEKALIRALEINPQRIEAITNLGYLYHKIKEYPRAMERFKKALNLDPNLIDVRLALSDIYFRLYDIDHLVETCDALLMALNLPRHITLESFKELSALYEKIGETLSTKGSNALSLMAHHVSFLIHPTRTGLDRIISMARDSGRVEDSIEKIQEALAFRRQESQESPAFEGRFEQA
jgi:tetratricopeptide (TPR) repeat protein